MSYLLFTKKGLTTSGLTEIWTVSSLGGVPLGEIKWFSQWRKYTFFPVYGTTFDSKCLIEIAAHCEAIQKNRES